MDTVVRGLAIYFFLWLIFRVTGKRSLSELTTFDFVLLLVISETTQQGLLGEDFSFTGAALLIVTLMGADVALSLVKRSWPRVEMLMDGVPMVIVKDGAPLKDRMKKERVDEDDVMAAARELQGLERMDQIKYAVLERNGGITIIPR